MSQDLQRLRADIEADFGLAEEFHHLVEDFGVWASWAQSKGYAISLTEAENLVDLYNELGDEDLDQVAGGWSG